jgi:hypothetical protein
MNRRKRCIGLQTSPPKHPSIKVCSCIGPYLGCKLTQPEVIMFAGWYLSPDRQLAECWNTHAISLALGNICCPQKYGAPQGLMVCLPKMIASARDDSAVVLVCRAIGHALLFKKVETTEARSRRAASYGQALTATNTALKDPTLQMQDETLASVWLLSLYEVSILSVTRTGHPRKQGTNQAVVADRFSS